MTFLFPLGCDPSMQSFLCRPKAYKFSYQGVILHVLDLSIDSVTWELNLGSFGCNRVTGSRCHFGSCISICIVYQYIKSCSRFFLGLFPDIFHVHLNVFTIIGGGTISSPWGMSMICALFLVICCLSYYWRMMTESSWSLQV